MHQKLHAWTALKVTVEKGSKRCYAEGGHHHEHGKRNKFPEEIYLH